MLTVTKDFDVMFLLALRGARMRPVQLVVISLLVSATAAAATVVFGYAGLVVQVTEARVSSPEPRGVLLARMACGVALGAWRDVLFFLPFLGAASITCLLTVSLMGRKRTLGIIRAVGGSTRNLHTLLLSEAAVAGIPGLALGLGSGQVLLKLVWGTFCMSRSCLLGSSAIAFGAVALGSVVPLVLLRNATTDQLLMNKPVYVIPNPSCSKCGACGGI